MLPSNWLSRRATYNGPTPFSFAPSQTFDGDDGSWSTFTIRVGTPPQTFRVLPATNSDETWVPVPAGCKSTGYPKNCGDLRGVNPFQISPSLGFDKNASSTWVENGIYNLLMEQNLGLDDSANGDYGFDSVGLGNTPTGPTLPHQVVAGIATNAFWLGYLGLGPKPVNFSTSIPSFMKTLADQNMIPSLSYGYTAGAKYHDEGIYGSLILGGYDNNRHFSNNITFDFDPNDSASLTVGLQTITATQTLGGTVTVLEAPGIYSLIDSGVPELWLPATSCEVFKSAFGLTYDKNTQRYLINNTMHSYIQQLNASISFTLGPLAAGGPSVAIHLPYAAFDLEASFPLYPNATKYFPIRQAANSTQYTIGRVFLQEAYITVDYERSEFHVSQATFSDSGISDIVAITSPNARSGQKAHPGSSFSIGPGVIAGISLGAGAIFLILCAFAYLFIQRRQRKAQKLSKRPDGAISMNREWKPELPNNEWKQANNENIATESNELRDMSEVLPEYSRKRVNAPNSRVHQSHDNTINSLLSSDRYTELPSPATTSNSGLTAPLRPRQELVGSPGASELDHRRLTQTELDRRRRPIYELPGDDEWMTELADSASKAQRLIAQHCPDIDQ